MASCQAGDRAQRGWVRGGGGGASWRGGRQLAGIGDVSARPQRLVLKLFGNFVCGQHGARNFVCGQQVWGTEAEGGTQNGLLVAVENARLDLVEDEGARQILRRLKKELCEDTPYTLTITRKISLLETAQLHARNLVELGDEC